MFNGLVHSADYTWMSLTRNLSLRASRRFFSMAKFLAITAGGKGRGRTDFRTRLRVLLPFDADIPNEQLEYQHNQSCVLMNHAACPQMPSVGYEQEGSPKLPRKNILERCERPFYPRPSTRTFRSTATKRTLPTNSSCEAVVISTHVS